MSGRTVPRFALASLLVAGLAAAAGAQPPTAPMPRPAGGFGFQIEIDLSFAGVLERVRKTPPPCCAFDCPARIGVAVAPAPRSVGSRPAMRGGVLSAGEHWKPAGWSAEPAPVSRFAEVAALPPSPAVERCEGVVRGTPARCGSADMRVVYPLAGVTAIRRDESGTWWVEAQGVPQPKHSQPALLRPIFDPSVVAAAAEVPARSSGTAGKLSGTWVRDLDGVVIVATLTGDELKLCMTHQADFGGGEAVTITLTLTADYAVTKEGLVHGVVTGVDVTSKSGGGAGVAFALELAGGAAAVQQAVDSPFSFRVKHTSAGVMVSNIKAAGVAWMGGQELALLGGLYAPCPDGKVPAPKPMKAETWTGGMTLPSPKYLDHPPQYSAPGGPVPMPSELKSVEAQPAGPPVMLPPPQPTVNFIPAGAGAAQLGTPAMLPPVASSAAPASLPYPGGPPVQGSSGFSCPPVMTPPPTPQAMWAPPPPPNVPPGDFGMMADVFGQMLGVNKPGAAPQLLPPPPVPTPSASWGPPIQVVGGVVPSVPSPAPQALPAAKSGLVGTWVREVGPAVYVVKIERDHMTVTASGAMDVGGGKVVTEAVVMTADYHLGRDGTTVVGLITSVDMEFGGQLPEGAEFPRVGEDLSRIQKGLTDKPFALGVRVYGDSLVIGNVRLPEVAGERGAWSPLNVLGGRYTSLGNKPLPAPKAVKMSGPPAPSEPAAVQDLRSRSQELRDAGQQIPPASDRIPMPGVSVTPPPVVSELPVPVAVPADRIPPAGVSETPPPAPPTPPEQPKRRKKAKEKAALALPGFLLNVYSSDPDVRMQQLLHQSEDLRQIQNEWRKFWFNDQPGHLTPERIHGPILP